MERSIETYREVISHLSSNTQMTFESAYKRFLGLEEWIASKPDENQVYDKMQRWINSLELHPTTVKAYFGHVKRYLYYRGIKLQDLDVRQNLRFPSPFEEELHPLSREESRRILEECNSKYRLMYLAQLSSGMRIGELAEMQKKHLDTTKDRIMVKIPSTLTKTRRSRTTFFSKEVSKLLLPKLDKMDESDLVFSRKTSPLNRQKNPIAYMNQLVKRIGLGQKYETNRRNIISTHSFRAFFITQISRHDPNIAKMFAGQKGYLLQYDRLADDEKLEKYIEFEPNLIIMDFEGTRRENKQVRGEKGQLREPAESFDYLKRENNWFREKVESIDELKRQIQSLEEKVESIDELKRQIQSLRENSDSVDELRVENKQLREKAESADELRVENKQLREKAESADELRVENKQLREKAESADELRVENKQLREHAYNLGNAADQGVRHIRLTELPQDRMASPPPVWSGRAHMEGIGSIPIFGKVFLSLDLNAASACSPDITRHLLEETSRNGVRIDAVGCPLTGCTTPQVPSQASTASLRRRGGIDAAHRHRQRTVRACPAPPQRDGAAPPKGGHRILHK